MSQASRLRFVARSVEPASFISPSVTDGTGHLVRKSLQTFGKKSLAAAFLWLASIKAPSRLSSHSSCSSVIHFLRVMFTESGYRNGVPGTWIQRGRLYLIFVDDILFVFPFFGLELNCFPLSPQEMASQRRPEGSSSLRFITLRSDNDNGDRFSLFAQTLRFTTSNCSSSCHFTTPTQLPYQAELRPNKPSTVKHHKCFQQQSLTSGSLCPARSPC